MRHFAFVPTLDIPGAAVVASRRNAKRDVPRTFADRTAWPVSHADLLYPVGHREAVDTGAGCKSSGSNQFMTLCIFDAVSQARQVT